MQQKPKLLHQARDKIRALHYSIRTAESYLQWMRRFIYFHNKRHPEDMGVTEIEQYLTYLATKRNVSASTQNQALAAILFLYQKVLDLQLPRVEEVVRAKMLRVFPSTMLSTDPGDNDMRCHQTDPKTIQRAVRSKVQELGMMKRITPHTFFVIPLPLIYLKIIMISVLFKTIFSGTKLVARSAPEG